MLKKTNHRTNQSSLLRVTALVLLVFYIAGTSSLPMLRAFIHDHQHVVHTAEMEKDPCHRYIFHNDAAQSCGHDSHLIASETCDMCDLVYQGDQTLLTIRVVHTAPLKPEFFSHCKVNIDSYWAVIASSRAPPAFT